MVKKDVKKAAIYARISKAEVDVDKVENQISELRKIAATHNYEVVAVLTDDDISAFKGKTPRAGFLELIEGLKANKYNVVMATEPQRFTRNSPAELEVLQLECTRAGAVIHTRAAGIQDPATPTTKAMMQFMDIIGGLEVETKIERQRARNRADLLAGIPTKGLRPFGWETDRITLRDSEALHIKNAYTSILERGESLWSIAQTWNSLKIRTDGMSRERKAKSDGEKRKPSPVWTSTTVRQMLVRPRNAGILLHNGEEMPKSKINPIVSREEFEALKSAIKGTPMPRGPKPQYLLGGLLECICGERMHASKSVSGRKGKPRRHYKIYRCRLYGFDKSQKHVTIQLPVADAAARELIIVDIGLGDTQVEIFDNKHLAELQSKLADLIAEESRATELIVDGLGDAKVLRTRLRTIQTEKSSVTGDIEKVLSTTAESVALAEFRANLDSLDKYAQDEDVNAVFESGLKAWDALSMEVRRSIIRGRYHVRVSAGGRGFERIEVSPK